MVRVNIINPKALADQHLVAEYLEIMMLVGYARKYPDLKSILDRYCLGKGHIKFFKNKLKYLKQRHEKIKKEMKRRGIRTDKTLDISGFSSLHLNGWKAAADDKKIIKERLIWKIKKKHLFYRYCGEKKPLEFFIEKIKKA